ncbi:unnamed protein product, partial [Chrysoparadoxa australica]
EDVGGGGREEEGKVDMAGLEDIVVELPVEKEDEKGEKKQSAKKIVRFTAKERKHALRVHQLHLAALVARAILVNAWANDKLVQSALLSCLSPDALTANDENGGWACMHGVTRLMDWHHQLFPTIIDGANVTDSEGGAGSRPERLLKVIEQRAGAEHEIVQLFLALCRLMGLKARYVSALDPISPKPTPQVRPRQTKKDMVDLTVEVKRKGPGSIIRSPAWVEVCIMPGDQPCRPREKKGQVRARMGYGKGKRSRAEGSGKGMLKLGAGPGAGQARSSAPPVKRLKGTVRKGKGKDKGKRPAMAVEGVNKLISAKRGRAVQQKGKLPSKAGGVEFKKKDREGAGERQADWEDGSPEGSVFTPSNGSSSDEGEDEGFEEEEEEQNAKPERFKTKGNNNERGPTHEVEEESIETAGEPGVIKPVAGEWRWVHVDCLKQLIDEPSSIERKRRKRRKAIPYIAAVDERSKLKDLTRKYCSAWSKMSALRPQVLEPWLTQLYSACDPDNEASSMKEGGELKKNVYRKADSIEDSQMEQMVATEQANLPSTLTAVKQSPVYCLKKHLRQKEMLRPGSKAVGSIIGNTVYSSKDISPLKTKKSWLSDRCMQIKQGEEPAKVVQFKGNDINLYGDWQVEPYDPGAVTDGKVPKNERGQVELWKGNLDLLPRGTVHLSEDEYPRMWLAARKLSVDYAPAVVGWDVHNGHSTIIKDGVVVCAEHREALVSAATQLEQCQD